VLLIADNQSYIIFDETQLNRIRREILKGSESQTGPETAFNSCGEDDA